MTTPDLTVGEQSTTERRDARKRKLYENQREREFYSYYESVLAYASTEPKFCDLHSPEAVAAHRAITSADTTLTAFVQLAALQIGARRAMIFFFDADYAYIIAESTRTLSLQDDSQHGPGDSLWLGFTKISRGLAVCEVIADESSNAQDNYSRSAHIINDLTKDARFCDRSYVKDGPKARFYAGVPITTSRGINIGSLCVLDDKPRDGLEPSQVEFLRSMASTVMSHLELVRAKEDNQRSRDMNSALAAFVEGKSHSADWWHHNSRSSNDGLQGATDAPKGEARIQTPNDRVPLFSPPAGLPLEDSSWADYFGSNDQKTGTDGNAEVPGQGGIKPQVDREAQSPTESQQSSRPTLESRSVSEKSPDPKSPVPSPHARKHTYEVDLPTKIRATASRAANLIQKGIGADGVLFLDATVGTAGALIDSTQGLSQTETETDGSRLSEASPREPQTYHHEERENAPGKKSFEKETVILGSAYSEDIEMRVKMAIEQAKFSDKVLKSLLRRYPNGEVWHFNAEGEASDEEDGGPPEENLSVTDAGSASELEMEANPNPTTKRANKKASSRRRDGRAIQSIFPGIRSLVFLGMWDPHSERFFGASIAVSYSSMRIFSAQNELSYIAAFCDVVLAEMWRLEAQELGRSKNQFVSSISHELRSPLDRNLNTMDHPTTHTDTPRSSAECLEEQEHSALSTELIRSITSCGNTLLDVVNDLLEYSRLNHHTQNRRQLQKSNPVNASASSDNSAITSERSIGDEADEEFGFMINSLTEDAVNAACLGFDHQSLPSKRSHGSDDDHFAALILNIEDSRNPDWLFSIASGSWKRICINLVSNALKYTPSGYINVTLRKTWLKRKPGKGRSAMVELMVEDSGIGMSDEFQVKSLFRPFRQENNLTPGTGLGLNLVAQIVKAQGGTVHVRSNQGRGTTVKVSVPLRPAVPTPSTKSRANSLDFSSPQTSVGFFGFGDIKTDPPMDPTKVKANRRLLDSMKRYCVQLGMPVYVADDNVDSNATIHITSEQALKSVSQNKEGDLQNSLLSAESLRKPIVVICATRSSALTLRSGPLGSSLPTKTQYLWLPIGPAKLAGALSTCQSALKEGDSDAAVIGAGRALSSDSGVEKDLVQTPPPKEIALNLRDESQGTTKSPGSTIVFVDNAILRVPHLHRPEKSGSEVVDKPIVSSLPLQTKIHRASTEPAVSTGTLSLLLVDDNAINLRLLEVFAKKGGHAYRTAQNGQEAVDVYERAAKQERADGDDPNVELANKPEVVLLDINMPVMNGFEAARAIRRFEHASGSARATIVAVTGLGDTSAQEQAFASGMDMFLTKPVKMKEVTAILSKLQGAKL